jgi:hypothetical protein
LWSSLLIRTRLSVPVCGARDGRPAWAGLTAYRLALTLPECQFKGLALTPGECKAR